MQHLKTYVANLKCGGCAATISKGLNNVEGVENVNITVENSFIELDYISDEALLKVRDKLINMGYPPTDEENSLILKGKSYISCMIGRISS